MKEKSCTNCLFLVCKWIFISILICACSSRNEQPESDARVSKKQENFEVLDSDSVGKHFTNPVMIMGTDIGRLFNAYYRTGQTEKLMPFLNQETKLAFPPRELQIRLAQLDYGYEMKLSGMQKYEDGYILSYKCQIQATTVIKKLKVVVEDDTCRIMPYNLERGQIFQNP